VPKLAFTSDATLYLFAIDNYVKLLYYYKFTEKMELLVAPVEHITFDLEHALSQQLGKSYFPMWYCAENYMCGVRKFYIFYFLLTTFFNKNLNTWLKEIFLSWNNTGFFLV
jgi:hypothetical protein